VVEIQGAGGEGVARTELSTANGYEIRGHGRGELALGG